jgi:hypothetical protein
LVNPWRSVPAFAREVVHRAILPCQMHVCAISFIDFN